MRHFLYILYTCICTCIGSLWAQPIDQHWLQKAEKPFQPQSKHETYWLMIPRLNDRVLIQVPHKTKPTYDPEEGSNFIYVDPTHPSQEQNTFQELPSGLFYWQSDFILWEANAQPRIPNIQFVGHGHIVRHRPHGEPYALTDASTNTYLAVQTGNKWNAKQLHPEGIEEVVAPPEQIAPGRHDEIRVTSCSMLPAAPYDKTSKNHTQINHLLKYHMQLAQKNPHILWGSDIICMQNWDRNLVKNISGYTQTISQIGNKQNATDILFDANVWKMKIHKELNLRGSKCIIATFAQRKHPSTRVTIACCNFKPGQTQEAALEDVHAVYTEAKRQAEKHNGHVILAGDLQYNTYTGGLKDYPIGKNPKVYQELVDTLDPLHDASRQTQSIHVPTAYADGYAHMDYVWHTPNLTCTSFAQFPDKEHLSMLITKRDDTQPAFGPYISDHATLRTAFAVK